MFFCLSERQAIFIVFAKYTCAMKILLVYPEFPPTYWSFKHALKFISKKAAFPPLGLVTVAAMLPPGWERRLVDLNIEKLKQEDLEWADYVFISAMSIQRKSVEEVVAMCRQYHKKIVAGGPLFTEEPESFDELDHLILNEAEVTLPQFLQDLSEGKPGRIYAADRFPDLEQTPVPEFSLLKLNSYASMSVQLTRGCPFNCDFCEITGLFGHKVRLKRVSQVLDELETLYLMNWRGGVFFVDDNFIGNRRFLKRELMPKLIEWNSSRGYPFAFNTEASINLADDEILLDQMVSAGFNKVFVGIETPDEDSLVACNKHQNNNRDLLGSVKTIHDKGIQVMAGFIVGFDSDRPSIFSRQIDFIQKSGIVQAMVGLLNAPRNTTLHKRLTKENRILNDFTGDNTDYSINFIPKMHIDDLMDGYRKILNGIYSYKPYYQRVLHYLKHCQPDIPAKKQIDFTQFMALVRSLFILGVFRKGRRYYWKLFFWSLFRRPKVFSMAITYSIYGYHYRRVFNIRS